MMRHAPRNERWTWFVLLCIAIAVLGRLGPLQLALLGSGLVAIGIGVSTWRRHQRLS